MLFEHTSPRDQQQAWMRTGNRRRQDLRRPHQDGPRSQRAEGLRRKKPEQFFRCTDAESARMVHVQCRDQRPALGRPPEGSLPFPAQVFRPGIGPGVEERQHRARLWVRRGGTRRLHQITAETRQGQIVGRIRAALAARYNVFDVKGAALKRLVHQTVLAPILSALAHEACGRRPRWASPRTPPEEAQGLRAESAIRSLNSTSASNSSRSPALSCPSVLRFMSRCNRSSVLGGDADRPGIPRTLRALPERRHWQILASGLSPE